MRGRGGRGGGLVFEFFAYIQFYNSIHFMRRSRCWVIRINVIKFYGIAVLVGIYCRLLALAFYQLYFASDRKCVAD